MGLTFKQFTDKFPNDEACLKYIFDLKFGEKYSCPQCGQQGKWHMLKNRRAYGCQTPKCGYHLYPCKDTPFAKSRTSLQSWFYAMYLFSTSRHGVPAKELERQLGVTYKCAWRMAHEIRKYMGDLNGDEPLKGTVEVDETWIGGKATHSTKKQNKAIVFGMVERGGKVRTQQIENINRNSLMPPLKANIEKGSTVYTDGFPTYKVDLPSEGYNHDFVSHSSGQYVKGATHTNTIEGYWSGLKRGIKGAHIHVSKKHLAKYGAEFEYRYNRRSNPDEIFYDLVSSL